MKQEKTQLGIILAIEEANTEQLKALSRIEHALSTNGSVTTQKTVEPTPSASIQGVTVKAKRRHRNTQSSASVSNQAQNKDQAEKIAGQIAKVNAPFEKRRSQRKEQDRDSKGRFISAEALRNLSGSKLGNSTVVSNERIHTIESNSGITRNNTVSTGIANLPLMKNIKNLNDTIAEQTSEVVRIDKNGRKRDGNGRFLSKEKSDELKAKNAGNIKSAEGKLQDGFLKRLGSALTEHGNGNIKSDGADIVGSTVGGPLWQMGRGAWDIASTAKENTISVNKWRKKHFSREDENKTANTRGHAEGESYPTSGNLALKPAIAYPPVATKPTTLSDAPDASQKIFEGNTKKEQVRATEKQTATLSAKDDAIIKNQEEELDLLKKIAKNGSANDPLGKGLFKKLFGGLGKRIGNGNRNRKNKTSRSKKPSRFQRIKDKVTRKNTGNESDVGEKAKKSGKSDKTEKERSTRSPNADRAKPEVGKPTANKTKQSTSDNAKPGERKGSTDKTKSSTEENDKSKAVESKPSTEKTKPVTTDGKAVADKPKPATIEGNSHTEKSDPNTKASNPEKVNKPAIKDGGKVTVQSEKSVLAKGGINFSESANDAVGTTEKVGTKVLEKEAVKTGGKVALKTGLKAIPVIGTAAGVAWDAADGYNDTEGQKKAFDLKDGQQATKREKTEMSAANVAGLGGLIPLASQGASWLANKTGLTDKKDALDVDTSDIAKGIHKSVGAVGSAATGAYSLAKGLFSTSNDDKAVQATQSQQVSDITSAIKSGSVDTVNAIDRLTKQLEGGKFGEDGVGAQGTKTVDYQAPATSTVVSGPNGLNIGGTHAANRNFRNNNFGNLNFAGQEGAVLEDTPGKGKARFARFATPEDGFRALANQVSSYANGTSKAAGYQKLNTVSDIISKWAPPNENDTAKYIQTISASLGVKPTDKINTADPQVMTKLIRAISTYEGGNPTVSDGYIQNSIGSEDATTHKWAGGSYSKESQEYMAKKGISAAKGMKPIANGTATSNVKTAETIKTAIIPESAKSPATANDGVKEVKKTESTAVKTNQEQATKPSVPVNVTTSNGTSTKVKNEAHSEDSKSTLAEAVKTAPAAIAAEKAKPETVSEGEQNSVASKAAHAGEVMSEVGRTNWLDKGAESSAKADKYLTEKLEAVSGQHVGFRRATSELTLPKNSGPVPESIKAAMPEPEKIAKAQVQGFSVTDHSQSVGNVAAPTAPTGNISSNPEEGIVPLSMVNQAFPVDPKTGKAQLLPAVPQPKPDVNSLPVDGVIPANMVNRAFPVTPGEQGKGLGGALSQQTEPKKHDGFFGSIGNFFSDVGHSAMNAAPKALSAVGDIAMPAAKGLLGNIVGDLGGQVSSSIGSPIIKSLATPFIDKGVSATNSFIQSPQQAISSFSMPQVLPTVTDLAKSGASNAMQQITAQMPPDIGKALMQLVDLTKQSLDAQKNKGDSKPDVVTHGGQKAPKHDDKFRDSALDALLED